MRSHRQAEQGARSLVRSAYASGVYQKPTISGNAWRLLGRAKSCCRRRANYAGVIARSALCDEAIFHPSGIASLRPAKTMPDCARNDAVAWRSRISGCDSVTKLQHGITLASGV